MFRVMSVLPFSAKNAFVTAYLLNSFLARFKNVMCCFQTISCLPSFKERNQWISSAACLFSPLWKRTRSSQMYSPETFPSNMVTKETSQILLQTLWHFRKPQINLVSLWGDSFADVGYNIGLVETLLGCINRYRVFWTGLLLTPTVAT